IAVGRLPRFFSELPKDSAIITQCATGYRAQIAASLLRANGFENTVLMSEPMEAWEAVLPTESN
ncbi:MAG: rhodanese-like domain-containing protein, partial [Caldilineaceae bacterium]|nr:rhodanese-like domain-containing protein [Caldilineaceae bacterium]